MLDSLDSYKLLRANPYMKQLQIVALKIDGQTEKTTTDEPGHSWMEKSLASGPKNFGQ